MAKNPSEDEAKFRLRSYQEEMLQASLRENVIVKMDTGSGKTAIAVTRAEAALNTSGPDKLVWLLAPTVPLCTQHAETVQERLPGYQVRQLVGSDGIDRWSDQETWDAALKNIRIVISVGAILRDALDNAFVKIENISLLIFDEAHHCVKHNAGAVLMKNWYFPAVEEKRPKVLGLSASIVKPWDLEVALDARVITPTRSRSELLNHVNRPVLEYLRYSCSNLYTPKLAMLDSIQADYNINEDPYFMNLSADEQEEFMVKNKATFCFQELRALYLRATHIAEQLGPAMGDWYLENSVRAIITRLESIKPHTVEMTMSPTEALYLSNLLRPLQSAEMKRKSSDESDSGIAFARHTLSSKLNALIDFLEAEWTETFTGLIFVQQRTLAYALAHLLSQYEFQHAKLRVQGFVGTSKVQDPAKRLVERILPGDQKAVLEKFRSPQREINLLVATEVLGEGVDVPQCHLVVCFDTPPQITSYVQKRGRARMKDSKYVLMLDDETEDVKIKKWQKLEAELEQAYQEEKRAWAVSQQLEEREDEGLDAIQFRVQSTGALLDLNNAVAKLHHVCQCTLTDAMVDLRPQFAYKEHSKDEITATVTLPMTFEPKIRVAECSRAWLTEKMAKREAAFNALRQLYEYGLLNEHLLPLRNRQMDLDEIDTEEAVKQKSFCAVLPSFNPWVDAARRMEHMLLDWHILDVVIEEIGGKQQKIAVTVYTPISLPSISEFNVIWDHNTQYTISGTPSQRKQSVKPGDLERMRLQTDAILRLTYGSRMPPDQLDFPFCLSLSVEEMEYWRAHRGHASLSLGQEGTDHEHARIKPGIVWHEEQQHYFQSSLRARLTEGGMEEEVIEVTKFPKRRDFLHPFLGSQDSYTNKYSLPASECTLEPWSSSATVTSLFVPSLLRRIELALVTERLRGALIPHLRDENLPLLQAAITSRAAREQENYERLEFLGDTYFNFLTSLNLMVERPFWPEGYLTKEKGQRVSNNTFCEAALNVGLDQYIILREFTGLKWVPPYAHKLLIETETLTDRVESSKKRVADVVEATIAAAYIDGGDDGAIKLCRTYFPLQAWQAPEQQAIELYRRASDDAVHLGALEDLIGYKFRKPSLLLEAMTSSAYKGGDQNARSYERLEFFGDAVLDYLVVGRIYNFDGRKLPHHAMHSIKTAMVNSWILGYLCMEHSMLEERDNIVMEKASNNVSSVPTVEQLTVKKHIWQYIRPGFRTEKEQKSLTTFQEMRDEIQNAFEGSAQFPWALLSSFNPSKIFSDIIESILGAIYIDSHANVDSCDGFLSRIGLFQILSRLLQDNVACMHPKELLGIAAEQRTVHYTYGEDDKMFTCQVLIGDEQVGGMVRAETKDMASTLAAAAAVEIEQQGQIYDMVAKAWKAVTEDKLCSESLVDDSKPGEITHGELHEEGNDVLPLPRTI